MNSLIVYGNVVLNCLKTVCIRSEYLFNLDEIVIIVNRLSEFLADAAQRIMILEIVFKRVVNRYHKLLLYMGIPVNFAKDMKVNSFCKIVSEFALEYRTTREKVMQQLAKKANQRERKKTRGKMIVDVSCRSVNTVTIFKLN